MWLVRWLVRTFSFELIPADIEETDEEDGEGKDQTDSFSVRDTIRNIGRRVVKLTTKASEKLVFS